MSGQEIRNTINENNAEIAKLMQPGIFVLNKKIQSLLNENFALRTQCKHEFENGKCKWCDQEEGK